MNWVGGSRARARAQQQQFKKTGINRYSNAPGRSYVPINQTGPSANEPMVEGDEDENPDNNEGARASIYFAPAGRQDSYRRSTRGRREENPSDAWKKEVDYSALGYELVDPEPVQRRVVPLLELAEKKFAFGHVLSNQLSFQLDITRVRFHNPNRSLFVEVSENGNGDDMEDGNEGAGADDTDDHDHEMEEDQEKGEEGCEDEDNSSSSNLRDKTSQSASTTSSSFVSPILGNLSKVAKALNEESTKDDAIADDFTSPASFDLDFL